MHAEARLIAAAAREGRATAGAVLYVTDFPCPPCAKLIAGGRDRAAATTARATPCSTARTCSSAAGVEIVKIAVNV